MGDSIKEHIEEYREWQECAGYSVETVRSAAGYLRRFAFWLSEQKITRTADLAPAIVHAYVAYTKSRMTGGRPLAGSSINATLCAVRVFLKWASKRRLLFFDLSTEFPSAKSRRAAKQTLSAVTVERVLSLPDTSTAQGLRDRTILEILYSTGIRRAEVSHLRVEDVNFSAGTMFIREGKGRKDRIVPVGDRALSYIKRYLDDARAELTREEGWLFPSRYGGQLSPNSITQFTGQYMRQAGIKEGSCHLLRHTMATLMLENGADVRYIQEMLGHAGIETTQVYTGVSTRHLRETMLRSHPVSWNEEPGFSGGQAHTSTHEPPALVLRLGKERSVPDVDPSLSSLHEALHEFRSWIMATHARTTAANAMHYLVLFSGWASSRGVKDIVQITPDLLLEYQKDLSGQPLQNGRAMTLVTLRNRMAALRSFFRWLWKSGRRLTDPSASLVLPRVSRRLPCDVLSVEEVERIVSMPDLTMPYGIRDRALIELLYATGMRKSELNGIRLDDLDHEKQTVRIVDAKTKDSRVIPVGSRAMRWIEIYLDSARGAIVRGLAIDHLFPSVTQGGRESSLPSTVCRKHMKAAGIHKKKACHIFRHTVATLMLENGADIRAVQEFLGHRSIRSTEHYTHVAIGKLKEVHAKTHPGERRYLERLREEEQNEQTPDRLQPAAVSPERERESVSAAEKRTISVNTEVPA